MTGIHFPARGLPSSRARATTSARLTIPPAPRPWGARRAGAKRQSHYRSNTRARPFVFQLIAVYVLVPSMENIHCSPRWSRLRTDARYIRIKRDKIVFRAGTGCRPAWMCGLATTLTNHSSSSPSSSRRSSTIISTLCARRGKKVVAVAAAVGSCRA